MNSCTLKDKLYSVVDVLCEEWHSICATLGIEDSGYAEWAGIVESEFKSLSHDLLEDARNQRNKVMTSIETNFRVYKALCNQLSVDVLVTWGGQGVGYYKVERDIIDKVKELQEQVDERLKSIEELRTEAETVCNDLGRKPSELKSNPLPNAEELENYKWYIEELKAELSERVHIFKNAKKDIMDIVRELNYKPSLDFERMIIGATDSSFALTDPNMRMLKEFQDSMKQKRADVIAEVAELRDRIVSLWDMLSEDLQMRDEFLQKYTGYSAETVKALKDELHRCEKSRKANIEMFVKKLRSVLEEWWDKCGVSIQQRTCFEYFHDELYTEDLLSLHDLEVQKWQNYYEGNKDIFELLHHREKNWIKLLELDEKASCADRYRNRGGQLLKEEKMRNALSKKIPEMEAKLLEMADAYERKHLKPFTFNGHTILEVIEKSHEERTTQKKQKLSARKQQKENTIGKSCLSMMPSTTNAGMLSTPSRTPMRMATASTGKRKLAKGTPVATNKRTKVLADVKNGPKSEPPKILLNDKPIGKARIRFSTEKSKRKNKAKRLSKMMNSKTKPNVETSSDEYECFQKELKIDSRSTMCSMGESQFITPVKGKTLKAGAPLRTTPTTPKANKAHLSVAPGLKLAF